MREALQCITQERLILADRSMRLMAGNVYPIDIGLDDPVPLRVEPGYPSIGITIAQSIRIEETGSPIRQARFAVNVIRYFYALTTAEGNEILAFHWSPQDSDPDKRPYPHLHVGAVNLDPNGIIRPGTFHKMHIPTGHISIEAVIRLAVTELSVRPFHPDWEQILERTEDARSSY